MELRDLAARRDLLERLCFIQRRMARHGALEIKDDLSGVDIETIHRMFRICKDGHIDGNFSVSAMIPPSATPARWDPNGRDVRLILEGGRVRLLNIEIPIGKVRVLFNDPSQFLQAYMAAQRQATLTGKAAPLRLNNVPAIQEYLEWLPQRSAEDRLHDVAVVQAGYFTRNQARESGLDPDTLGAFSRVENVAAGIYRFIQFPPSEHEDLMVLWLQTNRRAVISHDSALALHGLSDVLPSKRHITLPGSCEIETEGVQAGVVVHRGVIDERDVMWIASVPVTTPLRTVLDCVAAGLPKEHLERAVADGLERGLFTRADLPEIATARSA